MKGYLESDELSFFSGDKKTKGWKATLERYQKKYQGEGKEMGKLPSRNCRSNCSATITPWCAADFACN